MVREEMAIFSPFLLSRGVLALDLEGWLDTMLAALFLHLPCFFVISRAC